MNNQEKPPSPIADWIDWTDIPIIMAIARCGSLSRAATLLGVSQPTLSRRLDACEQRTGIALFSRGPSGVVPTHSGHALLGFAEQANSSLLAAQVALVNPKTSLSGSVRITASEWLCQTALPPMIASLTRAYPALHVELVADAGLHSLPHGDSDIALRPLRFAQNTVFQTVVGTVSFGLYASPSYLAEYGTPSGTSSFAGHKILHLVTGGKVVAADTTWLKRVAHSADIVTSCNGRIMLAECARSHQGIACLPRFLGERMGGLRRIPLGEDPPSRKLWLGTSKSARRFEKVQVVREHLRERFREIAHELEG